MGIVISGSYDKMKDIESTVKKMEQENNKNEIQVFSNSNKNTEVEAEENNITAELADSESNVENNADNTEYVSEQEKTDEQNNTNEETQTEDNIISQTMATDSREYVIEEGDTLMSISIKMYDSPDYVDAIMETNNIKEGDTIYTGQKIYIPYIR
jgi:nucleoid-associated protein YgaU